jgi:cytochrome c peroxidase
MKRKNAYLSCQTSQFAMAMVVCLWSGAWGNDITPPKGLPPVAIPADNPITDAKVELGKQLYFDKRLSKDSTLSCATCHDPAKGWSNGEATAAGFGGARGGRSSPTVLNTAYQKFQFWDGRAGSLEQQALGPIQNPIEMNLPLEELESRLNQIEGYRTQFQAVFGSAPKAADVAKAIAAFERTVLSGDAPYDRFKAGDTAALSGEAQQGMKLFFGRANCSACHSGPNFSDNAFHNIGVGMDKPEVDKGREELSKLKGDRGSFKTPTLREIARTAPYMHNGQLATLEEVIDYYDKGGTPNEFLDEELYALKLTPEEKKALATFLREGLASQSYPDIQPPTLPQ